MKHLNYKIALGWRRRLGKATLPPERVPVQGNATRHKASLELEQGGRSGALLGLYAREGASFSGLASKGEQRGVGLSAQPGCTLRHVEEGDLRVWRNMGVEKLLSGGARLEGVDREEPEAQVSIRILVRWLLPTCCAGITQDLLPGKPSRGGVGGVVVGERRGFPSASHPLEPSGIYHKVLELHGMTAMVSLV